MKILHIIDSGGMYGAEVTLLNLAQEQVKLGDKPVIASIGDKSISEKPIENEAKKKGIAIEKFRMASGPNIFGAYKILHFAKLHGFDVLHSHGYKGNILMGFIPKYIRKIPLICTLHGYTSTSGFSRMKIYEWLDTFIHRYLDAVVLVNKGMLNHPKLKNRSHLYSKVINNGIPVDDSDLTPENNNPNNTDISLQKKLIENFAGKRFVIGAIGRLTLEKGFKYLINAFSLVFQQKKDICLVIIGEGQEEQFLKKLISQHNLDRHVLMTGYIDNARRMLPCFDLFIIPSLTEGLPITLLDAMYAKVPVIASKVGGIPDVLDNGDIGVLFQPGDHMSLKNAIREVIKNSEFARQISIKAFKKVITCYSSKNMALEYQDLYKNILT
ncbi:MAG: glycosyltransferase family 4 protein [Desulfobacula sp.]|nr:glycosyltransferase family 4 protein [Desulfobacula sp.]